ncbi:MAG: AAA family ATPase, partial [Pseudomonadota bacterium]|nr:AAA family ATPase [Pseudomonadota bacterium]
TERNLEKVISMIKALGPIGVIIDEIDRSMGNASGGETDGGTESRVIATLKQFMSDTENRGNVLFVVMTNRPDKLDIDLKRPGRLDVKIPFFYMDNENDAIDVLGALAKRYGVELDLAALKASNIPTKAVNAGYSNADYEAVLVQAMNAAADPSGKKITQDEFAAAFEEFMPTRDQTMITYMNYQAVLESSRRSMLPKKFADLSSEQVVSKLSELKLQYNIR